MFENSSQIRLSESDSMLNLNQDRKWTYGDVHLFMLSKSRLFDVWGRFVTRQTALWALTNAHKVLVYCKGKLISTIWNSIAQSPTFISSKGSWVGMDVSKGRVFPVVGFIVALSIVKLWLIYRNEWMQRMNDWPMTRTCRSWRRRKSEPDQS